MAVATHFSAAIFSFLLHTTICDAFVLPTSTTAAFVSIGRSSSAVDALPDTFFTDSAYTMCPGNTLLLGVDLSAQAGDGIRSAAIGLLGVAAIITAILSAGSVLMSKSVMPKQMEKLAYLVEKESPERWAEIQSKLADGEKIADRGDLMAELIEVGVNMMMDEGEDEMKNLLIVTREKKEQGAPLENLREPLETAFGVTIEEFIRKVDNNSDSKYLTETGKEMADLLRADFEKRKTNELCE